MKGTFFSKPLEWNIETDKESWAQGETIKGTLKVKNHGSDPLELKGSGVGLAHADIKKVHARTEGSMKFETKQAFESAPLAATASMELAFSLKLPDNCPVTDKKASFFLTYGKDCAENHLMLKIEPKALYGKVIGLMDTFQRFKLKEYKSGKAGVEYKLLPPSSRDMAHVETLSLTFSMQGENLQMDYEFIVKKIGTEASLNKINKEGVKLQRLLTPKDYSFGKDLINQDVILKSLESAIAEVKMKAMF
jgi:hypothetical protein